MPGPLQLESFKDYQAAINDEEDLASRFDKEAATVAQSKGTDYHVHQVKEWAQEHLAKADRLRTEMIISLPDAPGL